MNQEDLIRQSYADALYVRQFDDNNIPEMIALCEERDALLKELSILKARKQDGNSSNRFNVTEMVKVWFAPSHKARRDRHAKTPELGAGD